MKSSDIDQDLFTDSYCKVCSAQLISESQRVAHYESRKHASKVRLYYMLHPRDGGCPAKRLRSENGSDADMVDKNKCCTLCNMSFTSAVVADSHYQGKIHAKRLKLLLGEKTPLKTTATPLNSLKPPRVDAAPVVASPYQRRDSDRYCGLCAAWFNNPLMAQQHYDGKKHKKNAARVALLEQLGTTLDMGELRGLRRNYRCTICSVSLNSIEQYHAHLKGSKHQTKSKSLDPAHTQKEGVSTGHGYKDAGIFGKHFSDAAYFGLPSGPSFFIKPMRPIQHASLGGSPSKMAPDILQAAPVVTSTPPT
ncbi:zinc finger matrin-type protein 4 [Hyaena hyaena]|uniref:zinc finger matrin-type protein 4 n=1 Tax=Hyaena hyaena TaxID=95912 RepID=UPI001924F6BC|nr:zinc finger matrin-type protein 4 [Hyaena hyaena]